MVKWLRGLLWTFRIRRTAERYRQAERRFFGIEPTKEIKVNMEGLYERDDTIFRIRTEEPRLRDYLRLWPGVAANSGMN